MSLPPSRYKPDFHGLYGDCSRDVTRQVAALAALSGARGGHGYAGSHKVIDVDSIMAGKLGGDERGGLLRLLEEKAGGGKRAKRGSTEGLSEPLPLLRRYDTRCFALEVLGDESDMEHVMDAGNRSDMTSEGRGRVDRQSESQGGDVEVRARKRKEGLVQSAVDEGLMQPKKLKADVLSSGGDAAVAEEPGAGGPVGDQGLMVSGPREAQEPQREQRERKESLKAKLARETRDEVAADVYTDDDWEDGGTVRPSGGRRKGRGGPSWVAYCQSTEPFEEVSVGKRKVLLPPGWHVARLPVGLGAHGGSRVQEVFVSPEGIACFSAGMMDGCECTRKRGTLSFERVLRGLKADVVKMAREPMAGAISDFALGRDGVIRYRIAMLARRLAGKQMDSD